MVKKGGKHCQGKFISCYCSRFHTNDITGDTYDIITISLVIPLKGKPKRNKGFRGTRQRYFSYVLGGCFNFYGKINYKITDISVCDQFVTIL